MDENNLNNLDTNNNPAPAAGTPAPIPPAPVNPAPAPTPAPEAPAPAPAPASVPTPTSEPALAPEPAPASAPVPETPAEPVVNEPAAQSAPAIDPAVLEEPTPAEGSSASVPAASKKSNTGLILGVVLGVVVLVCVGVVVFFMMNPAGNDSGQGSQGTVEPVDDGGYDDVEETTTEEEKEQLEKEAQQNITDTDDWSDEENIRDNIVHRLDLMSIYYEDGKFEEIGKACTELEEKLSTLDPSYDEINIAGLKELIGYGKKLMEDTEDYEYETKFESLLTSFISTL